MKLMAFMLVTLSAYSACAFDSLESTLTFLKKTGIEAGGMEFKCPEGFSTSKELSNVPASFSRIQCEKKNKDTIIVVQIESIPAAKKNRIGRVFFSYIDLNDNKNCTIDHLKKYILPKKATKVVNQSVNFDYGKDFNSFVACAGVGSGYFLDIQTKIWSQLMK